MRYFLAIIGGGPAGYTAAEKASKAGKDVVLFEQNALGGTCLNVGCIPTKSLLYGAKQYFNATHAQKYGVTAAQVAFDFGAMQKRKTIVV
jgi:dihydrolipoamide dehydrogenase